MLSEAVSDGCRCCAVDRKLTSVSVIALAACGSAVVAANMGNINNKVC